MRKIFIMLMAAGALGFLWTPPAAARPNNDGEVQRKLTEAFGGIGRSLDSAGQSFAKVFWEKPDID